MSDSNKTMATEVAINLDNQSVDEDETAANIEFTCSSIVLPQEFRPGGPVVRSTAPTVDEESVESRIKLAVLESKVELIARYSQEAKSLELEVNKLINHIYKSNPNLKNELLRIKKLVTDHASIAKILEASKAS